MENPETEQTEVTQGVEPTPVVEAPVPAAPVVSADSSTVSVKLTNDVRINGVAFEAGVSYSLPADEAANLEEIDALHSKYLDDLNKNNAQSGSLGSISAA